MPPTLLVDTGVLAGTANAFPSHWLDGFDLLPYPPRQLLAADPQNLQQADAVLLRSITQLGDSQLPHMPALSAVATLSSGTDHIDSAALQQRQVTLHTGHGGNARAVVDWVQWVLERVLPGSGPLRVLIVGVGAVGGLLARRLLDDGVHVVVCDPPRAEREEQAVAGLAFVDLDAALAQPLDAITLHVPLERSGRNPTANLLSGERLRQLAELGAPVVLNAARGGILDEGAAAKLVLAGRLRGLVLDTFAGEPRPDPQVVAACALATPHIAGHSIEGKLDVSHRALQGLRERFGLPPVESLLSAVERELAKQGRGEVPTAFAGLDECARSFSSYVDDQSIFDHLRHGHLRRERLPISAYK